jgi:proline iminopeptidase
MPAPDRRTARPLCSFLRTALQTLAKHVPSMTLQPTLRPLYPDAPPRQVHAPPVAHGHVLHVEEWGHPQGIPALVLHGGPGSSCTPLLRRWFDPALYRVVCFDQRGSGRSQPRGDIAHNTTALLLDDIRCLRQTLGVQRWLVVGGSWGATLALEHALAEPDVVAGLLLRGLFLARETDVDAFFTDAPHLPAGTWQRFAAAVPFDDPHGVSTRLADALASPDAATRRRVALAWWHWEAARAASPAENAAVDHAGPAGNPGATTEDSTKDNTKDTTDDAMAERLIDRYRVQAHYLRHGCWVNTPPLLDRCAGLPKVPMLMIHARQDRVCPPEGAAALHRLLPHSSLRWVDGAGHDPSHPAIVSAMVQALDHYAVHRSFGDTAG